MSRHSSLRTALAGIALAAVALTGCAASGSPSAGGSSAPADEGYITPGKLTIATGDTAYDPYVIDDDPSSGEGFEAAIAYAIADQLGFAPDDVEWVRTSFEAAIAPGPKNFDFNLQQYSITDERKQAVDFSSPYYAPSQAVVAIEGGAADGVDTIADLKDLLLGAMAGTTSSQTIEEVDRADVGPQLFDSNDDAVRGARRGPGRRVRRSTCRPRSSSPRVVHRQLVHRRRAARRRRRRRVGRGAGEGLARSPRASAQPSTPCARTAPSPRSRTSGSAPARASRS